MAKLIFVRSIDEAIDNIRRFPGELDKNPGLQERVSRVHSWHAARKPSGGWFFAPSKFAGYKQNTGSQYLRTATIAGGAHGGKTEALLQTWFESVDLSAPLGRELTEALGDFLAARQLMPRRSYRINVPRSELDKIPDAVASGSSLSLFARISSDPRVCGGRLCIKGTRMRVSDIVDMLAGGATQQEIVDDFPYISKDDIAAALAFAARAVDHRVIRAA